MIAKKISGSVQGIGFRATAARIAMETGINGYVKNLPSGDVELAIEGNETQYQMLLDTILQQLPIAQVTKLQTTSPSHPIQSGFYIL